MGNSIFPNPFSERLAIRNTSESMTLVKVYSSTGTVVSQLKVDANDETELDVRHLSTGIYFVVYGHASPAIKVYKK